MNHKKLRRRSVGAFAVASALALVACTGTNSPGGTASSAGAPGPEALASANGVVNVTFWHSFGGAAGEALDSLIKDFNSQNEGKIEAQGAYQGSYTDMLAKYAASLRDNSNPTVIVAGDTTSGYMRAVKHSQSPAAMAKANPDDLDLSQLRPAAAGYYSADGEMFAVPMAASTPVLWVNPTILKNAGLDANVSLKSIKDVYAVAKQVKEKTGVAGLVLHYDGWWFEQPTAMTGSLYCTPENGRSPSGEPNAVSLRTPAQVQAFTDLASIYLDGYGLDVGTDYAAAMSAFGGGQAAMMLFSSGAAGTVNSSGVDFEVRPFPTFNDSADGGPVVGGSAMWLSSTASDAEKVAGWKLISYLASPAAQEKWSQATGYVSVNSGVDSSPTQKQWVGEHPYAEVFIDQINSAPANTATAGCLSGAMTGIRGAVTPQMQAIFTGKISMDAGLEKAETDANKAVADYLKQAGG